MDIKRASGMDSVTMGNGASVKATVRKPENISTIYKPNLRIMVVEKEQLKFVQFFESKNAMVEPTCEQLS